MVAAIQLSQELIPDTQYGIFVWISNVFLRGHTRVGNYSLKVFNIDETYFGFPPSVSTEAYLWWSGIVNKWNGSSYGFAVSSLLGFYHKDDFIKANLMGYFENLFQVPLFSTSRTIINRYNIYQFGAPYFLDVLEKQSSVNVRQTLKELKHMFRKKDGDAYPLIFYNNHGSGSHAVVPYNMERINGTSSFNLRVYDSNVPGSDDQIIKIDSAANTWTEQTGLNWGTGTNNFFLGQLSGLYIFHPNIPEIKKGSATEGRLSIPKLDSSILIFNTSWVNITILGSNGNIGYRDSAVFNTFSDAVPVIPITGSNHPPIGYKLPMDNYSVKINEIWDPRVYATFFIESTVYNYRRFDGVSSETDLLHFSDGLGVSNPDASEKNIVLETLIDDNNSEKVFNISNVKISHDDSLTIKELNRENLIFNNYGANKDYDIWLRSASGDGEKIFSHPKINIAENTSHQIVPSWTNLETSLLMILIDNGIDGTIDDTLFIGNELTGIDDVRLLTNQADYKLYQNFPNPFSLTTKIKYSIPSSPYSNGKGLGVRLVVYDTFGKEVVTLVNKEQKPGNYEVEFNPNELPGGVYLYKLEVGGFSQIRKMILLK